MAGSDYTLADLVEDSGASAGGGAAAGGSGSENTGEWITDLVEKLDEKGYLDQLIASQMNTSQNRSQPVQEAPGYESVQAQEPEPEATQTAQEPSVDAEKLRHFMLQLYDNSERIPGLSEDPKLSELIQLVEDKPQITNQMLQEHL
jgi:hypothetical protein